jgi:hypothetical protein
MQLKTNSLLRPPAEWPTGLVIVVGQLQASTAAGSRAAIRAAQSALGRQLRQQALTLIAGNESDPARTSISHSGEVVVACAGHGLSGLGIDVEGPRPRSAARIATYMGWTDRLPAAGSDDFDSAFTRLWTLWEAAVKCDDSSVLARDTPGFTALAVAGDDAVAATDGRSWSGAGYRAARWCLGDGRWVTIVARERPAAIRAIARRPTLPSAALQGAAHTAVGPA